MQFLQETQFGKPWHDVYNALHIVDKKFIYIFVFSVFLYQYGTRLSCSVQCVCVDYLPVSRSRLSVFMSLSFWSLGFSLSLIPTHPLLYIYMLFKCYLCFEKSNYPFPYCWSFLFSGEQTSSNIISFYLRVFFLLD